MKIAHSKTGLRISLDRHEYDTFSDHGKRKAIWVAVSNRSTTNFINLAPNEGELPNSHQASFLMSSASVEFPTMLLIASKSKWPNLKNLPMFGPETAIWEGDQSANTPAWKIMRPPMTTPQNGGKRMPVRKELVMAKTAPLPAHRKADEPVSPEVVPLSQIALQGMSDKAMTISFHQAVDIINEAKRTLGKGLELEITDNGYLLSMMIHGGDLD